MTTSFSAPGKTFLAGEYLALDGGMALLAMTEPRFELRVQPGEGSREGLPALSPAGKLMSRKNAFSRMDLRFVDPHEGAGGWGASTAQYLTVYAAIEGPKVFDEMQLLADYRSDAWDGQGVPPSGADLIGQLHGGFTFFEKRTGMLSSEPWPFETLDGYLLKTGVKLATHEHLAKLKALKTDDLAAAMRDIRGAWIESDPQKFAEGVAEYGRRLQAHGLVAESTLSLLHDLLWLDGVKAAKGCGAMGADVIFVVLEKTSRRSFEHWLEQNEMTAIAIGDRLSGGLERRQE